MIIEAFIGTALIFAVLWGAMENRCWREQGESVILGHFKLYHLGMLALFGWVNSLTIYVVLGESLSFAGILSFVWLMVWDILMLDITWWVIRWWDFRINPGKAIRFYGEPNAWHLKTDWDNWLGLPLIGGTYWWWYVFAGILAVLGVVLVVC
jgi:hypothetical protein